MCEQTPITLRRTVESCFALFLFFLLFIKNVNISQVDFLLCCINILYFNLGNYDSDIHLFVFLQVEVDNIFSDIQLT